MRPNRRLWLILVMVALVTLLAGCPKPAKKPGLPGGAGAPGKMGQEPVISLFVQETGAKQNIALEKYLEGVVAGEMDPAWELNALAAQAILARTFTMKKIQEGGVKQHGTDASTNEKEFQAYAPEKINDHVRKAVQMTRGQVVTYQDRYIIGWFYADAGGRTAASAMEGLDYKQEPAPYVKSVKDPGWSISPPENKSWTARFPLEQVRAAVKNSSGGDTGEISAAKIVKRGPSGRATEVKVGAAAISAPALRLALGSDQMRSTLLSKFAVEGGALVASGRGFGHGVGMSQWGARALAQQGKKPADIVKYFFRDVTISKRW